MELLAAIDVLGGRAVRLVRGDLTAPEVFGDPREIAGRFLGARARRLHVVDLDAATTGSPVNRGVVLAVAHLAHGAGARVQVGGGVRSPEDVEQLVSAGVDTVVLGTAALEDPGSALECARRFPGCVAVALDYRRSETDAFELAARGWAVRGAVSVEDLMARFDGVGVSSYVATAIDRDGSLGGPDLEGLARLLDMTETPLVASGGISGRGDLTTLASLRSPVRGRPIEAAIVGRALVDGRLGVEEALEACAAFG